MGRIQQIAEATEEEIESYLDYLGWDENPFTRDVTVEDYVLPTDDDIADLITHINEYSGPVLIHSRYSGVGKTTLLKILFEELADDYTTVYIGEHNVTCYELVAIIADKVGVGKSSSTKLTEEKLAEVDFDDDILIGIDEFGLNDPDTLHTIQYLNDEVDCKIILTGMTSQWNAVETLGSEGRAFQRRVSYQLELESFGIEQTRELIKRRIASVTDTPYDEYQDVNEQEFIDRPALRELQAECQGVAGVTMSTLSDALTLVAYRHSMDAGSKVTVDLIDDLSIADPVADTSP